ncbi:DUF6314 family protein [Granulicella arctica]|uniref:DUF6314 domain-containing protein n=1 Tax=Granulicella arctica TaxID=940613 RepID=A0A7Y9PL77_9BACT|nr:DUF6314 family protein [Granulicella arctica]NYF81156.1 hypothetical protein [Granulicella arctica]
MALAAGAVFGWLVGEWSFVREIPGQASMTGRATVSPMDMSTALYEEWAEVRLAGGEILHGEQRYLYRKREAGLAVLFAETLALFHELEFHVEVDGCLRAVARHACSDDVYMSEYRIGEDESFAVRHEVRGPRKDYVIHTQYRRR